MKKYEKIKGGYINSDGRVWYTCPKCNFIYTDSQFALCPNCDPPNYLKLAKTYDGTDLPSTITPVTDRPRKKVEPKEEKEIDDEPIKYKRVFEL